MHWTTGANSSSTSVSSLPSVSSSSMGDSCSTPCKRPKLVTEYINKVPNLNPYNNAISMASHSDLGDHDEENSNSSVCEPSSSMAPSNISNVTVTGEQPGVKPIQFSQQLIAFTLYGTQKELGSEWPSSILVLSSRVMEVSKHFPDIPDIFKFGLSSVQFGAVGVFCCRQLQKDTILGPFTGKKLSVEEARKKHTSRTYWEIHRDGGVKYCLDGSDPAYRNWMYFIQYARSRSEQNLIAVQYNENLYFKAEREIKVGEEMLVWYDQVQYDLYMGIPQGFNNVSPRDKFESRHIQVEQNDSSDVDIELSDLEDEEVEIEDIENEKSNNISSCSPSMSTSNSEIDAPDDVDTTSSVSSDCNHSTASNDSSSDEAVCRGHQPFLHSSSRDGLPGFTAVYPLPTVHIPLVKHQILSPHAVSVARRSSTFPSITWPLIRPPPPSLQGHVSSHMHKPTTLDMFIRGVDGNRWQCQICQKIFTSQGSLRAHARIHTGERPYQCRFCKRTFTQASTLRSHERLHTGERPYKCKHCGKAFTQSAGLRSHLKTHIVR